MKKYSISLMVAAVFSLLLVGNLSRAEYELQIDENNNEVYLMSGDAQITLENADKYLGSGSDSDSNSGSTLTVSVSSPNDPQTNTGSEISTGDMIGTGEDTKKLNDLIGLDKSYETIIDFSKKSDTWDMGYRDYYEEINVEGKEISLEDIKLKLDSIIPEYKLPLTPFSAKKKDGKKLYDLARKGEQIIENRLMKTYGYEVLDYNFPKLKLRLDVGSGTYIRSIGHRLGEQFGLGGILTMLRRIKVGDYKLEEISLDKEGTFFRKEGEDISFKYGIIG